MDQEATGWPRHVRSVASFDALMATPFSCDVTALCWTRRLPGDFRAILDRLPDATGITTIDDEDLDALDLSGDGAVAREVLRADLTLLRGRGLVPSLDCIRGYLQDEAAGPIPTDVYSFHVDRAPVPADTFLCTYIGSPTEGIASEMVVRRVDVTETRGALLTAYGGADDAGFAAYLAAQSYDLHYAPLDGAAPYGFGIGNLWRIAIAYPGCPGPPCIHRAPRTAQADGGRLLLIS